MRLTIAAQNAFIYEKAVVSKGLRNVVGQTVMVYVAGNAVALISRRINSLMTADQLDRQRQVKVFESLDKEGLKVAFVLKEQKETRHVIKAEEEASVRIGQADVGERIVHELNVLGVYDAKVERGRRVMPMIVVVDGEIHVGKHVPLQAQTRGELLEIDLETGVVAQCD